MAEEVLDNDFKDHDLPLVRNLRNQPRNSSNRNAASETILELLSVTRALAPQPTLESDPDVPQPSRPKSHDDTTMFPLPQSLSPPSSLQLVLPAQSQPTSSFASQRRSRCAAVADFRSQANVTDSEFAIDKAEALRV